VRPVARRLVSTSDEVDDRKGMDSLRDERSSPDSREDLPSIL